MSATLLENVKSTTMSVPKPPVKEAYVVCDCDQPPEDYCENFAKNTHPCPDQVKYVETADIDYSDKGKSFSDIKWGADKAQQYQQGTNKDSDKGYCSTDQNKECSDDSECGTAPEGQPKASCVKKSTTNKTTYTTVDVDKCCDSAPCRKQNLMGTEDECRQRAKTQNERCAAKKKQVQDTCSKNPSQSCMSNCINNKGREYIGRSLGKKHFATEEFGCVSIKAADKAGDPFFASCNNMSDSDGKITQSDCLTTKCALQWRHWGQLYAQNSLPFVLERDCPASKGNPVGQLAQGGVYCTGSLKGAIQSYNEMNTKNGGMVDPRTCGGGDSVCCHTPPQVDPVLYNRYFHEKYDPNSQEMVSVCSPVKEEDGSYKLVTSCDSSVTHTGVSCSLTVENTFALFQGDKFCETYSTKEACYKAAKKAADSKTCPNECAVDPAERLKGHMTIGVNDKPTEEACVGPSANYRLNNCWDADRQECYLKSSSMLTCDIHPMERVPGKGVPKPSIDKCLNVQGNCWEGKVYDFVSVPQCYLNKTESDCDIPYKMRVKAFSDDPDVNPKQAAVTDSVCAENALDPTKLMCYEDCKANHNCASVPSCYYSKASHCHVPPDQRIYGSGTLNANNVPINITRKEDCPDPNCWDPFNGGIECYYPNTVDRCPAKNASCTMVGQMCAEAPGYECKAEPNLGGCAESGTSQDFVCIPEGDSQWRLHMNGSHCSEIYDDESKCKAAIQSAVSGAAPLCTDRILGESICCRQAPCWHPVTPVPTCRSGTPVPLYDSDKRQYCTEEMSCDECAAVGGPPITSKPPKGNYGIDCEQPGWCPPSDYGGKPYPQSLIPWCTAIQDDPAYAQEDELKTWCSQLVEKCETSTATCHIPGQQCLTPPGFTCSLEYNHDRWCDDPPCWKPNPLVATKSCPEGPCNQEGQMCENGSICKRQAFGSCKEDGSGNAPLCWVPQSTPPPKRTCPELRDQTGDMSCEYPGQTCLDMPNWVCRNEVNLETGCMSPPCWVGPEGSTTKCSSDTSFHKMPLIDSYLETPTAPVRWADFSSITKDCLSIQHYNKGLVSTTGGPCPLSMKNRVCILEDYMDRSQNSIFSGGSGDPAQGQSDPKLVTGGVWQCQQDQDPDPDQGSASKDSLVWKRLGNSNSVLDPPTQKVQGFETCLYIGQVGRDQFNNELTCQWNDPNNPHPLCPTTGVCNNTGRYNKGSTGTCSNYTDQQCKSDIQCQGCWIPNDVPNSCTDSEVDTVCFPTGSVFSSKEYPALRAIAQSGYICRQKKGSGCYNPPCWVPADIPPIVDNCGTGDLVAPDDIQACPDGVAEGSTCPYQAGSWCSSAGGDTLLCEAGSSGGDPTYKKTNPVRITYGGCSEGDSCTPPAVCNHTDKDGALDNVVQLVCDSETKTWMPSNPSNCEHLGQVCERTVKSSASQDLTEAEIQRYICTPMNDEGVTDDTIGRCNAKSSKEGCWVRQWPTAESLPNSKGAPVQSRSGTSLGCNVSDLGKTVDAGSQNMICVNDVIRTPQLVPAPSPQAGDLVYIGGEPQFRPTCTKGTQKYCQGNEAAGEQAKCTTDADCQTCQSGQTTCPSAKGSCAANECKDQQCFLPEAEPPCWVPSPKDPLRRCPPGELIAKTCESSDDGSTGCPSSYDLDQAWALQRDVRCTSGEASILVEEGHFLQRIMDDGESQFFQCVSKGTKGEGLVWMPYAKPYENSTSSGCCLIDIKSFECPHPGQECLPFVPNQYLTGSTPLPMHQGESCLPEPYYINPTCSARANASAIDRVDGKNHPLYSYGLSTLTSLPSTPKPIPTWNPTLCNPASKSSDGSSEGTVTNNCICQYYCTPGTPDYQTYFDQKYQDKVPDNVNANPRGDKQAATTLRQWCAANCSVNHACEANCLPEAGQGCFQPDPPPPTNTCPDWQCEYLNHICTVGPGYICQAQKTPNCNGPFCWVRAKHYTPDSKPGPEYNQEGIPGLLTTCPENECTVPGQVCSKGPGYLCAESANTQTGCMEPPCWHQLSTSCSKVHTFNYKTWVQQQNRSTIYPGDCILIPGDEKFPIPQEDASKESEDKLSASAAAATTLVDTTLFRYRGTQPISYMLVNPMTALKANTQWIASGKAVLDAGRICSERQNIQDVINCPAGIQNPTYKAMWGDTGAQFCCSTGVVADGETPGICLIMDEEEYPNSIYTVRKASTEELTQLHKQHPDDTGAGKEENILRIGQGYMKRSLNFNSLMNIRLDFKDAGNTVGHCMIVPWSETEDTLQVYNASSGQVEYYARYYTAPDDATVQEKGLCTVQFDSTTSLRLAPSGCLLYGEVDPNSDYPQNKCNNYFTPPPKWSSYCSQQCSECNDDKLGEDDSCDAECRRWCECLYSHTYIDNSAVWERIMELGKGQGAGGGANLTQYQTLNEVPKDGQYGLQKIGTAPPDKANQIECEQQCTEDNDCVGFILDTRQLPVQCTFYKTTSPGECPDCTNEDSCKASKADFQQWVYQKNLCGSS